MPTTKRNAGIRKKIPYAAEAVESARRRIGRENLIQLKLPDYSSNLLAQHQPDPEIGESAPPEDTPMEGGADFDILDDIPDQSEEETLFALRKQYKRTRSKSHLSPGLCKGMPAQEVRPTRPLGQC